MIIERANTRSISLKTSLIRVYHLSESSKTGRANRVTKKKQKGSAKHKTDSLDKFQGTKITIRQRHLHRRNQNVFMQIPKLLKAIYRHCISEEAHSHTWGETIPMHS